MFVVKSRVRFDCHVFFSPLHLTCNYVILFSNLSSVSRPNIRYISSPLDILRISILRIVIFVHAPVTTRVVTPSRCFRSAGRYFLSSRWLDGHLSISKSCRQSTTSYINTCEYMGCRPNVRAREERATPQFTCYPTSNATVPLGSGCDAIPPRVRRNVLKRKASSVGL